MTYSLNTLNNERRVPASAGAARFGQEIALLLGAAALLFWLLALVSHSLADPAWSTTGTRPDVGNWAGRLGALLSDISYYLFGFSVWWVFLAALRIWLSTLARWLRGQQDLPLPDEGGAAAAAPRWQRLMASRGAFWACLLLLLVGSTVLEWSRLYRLEPMLPDHAGGLLGHSLGGLFTGWLGFNGSALVMLGLVLACLPRVFHFSWAQGAERLGAWLEGWFEARREKREAVEDQRIGEQAAREREEVVAVEREEIEEHHPIPVVIETPLVEVPRSERVAKERQKPLFSEMPDSKLPQVDLLDSAPANQQGVDAQTLEMTSRLIEKKLKDFGVEVRVVAAAPGPVITRYEIEPATGVKGSQIVNLGRDLARSLSLVSIRVIETIPGKNLMALELPNAKRQTIKLSEILGSQVYNDARSLLTMGWARTSPGCRWWPTWPRCRTCWWPAPPVRASRWASTR